MATKRVDLGILVLALASEDLELAIASSLDISCPSGTNLSDCDSIVEASTSRSVWVARGRRCRIDINVSFNNQPLDMNSRTAILECLGRHLRDAHLWSQLSLSTSLEILSHVKDVEPLTDMAIYVNHAMSILAAQPNDWLRDNIDVKAPDSVLCAGFEVLRVQFHFHQIRRKPQTTSKRAKRNLLGPSTPESILLDYISGLEDGARLTFFEAVATILPNEVSSSIADFFDELNVHGIRNRPKFLDITPSSASDVVTNQVGSANLSIKTASELPKVRKGKRFPKEIVEILQAWLDAHPIPLSPRGCDLLELMKQTGLDKGMNQVYNWFKHARQKARRREKSSKNSLETNNVDESQTSEVNVGDDDHMLFSQFEQESLVNEDCDDFDADEMLLSESTFTTPSSSSQASAISSTNSLKRPALDEVIGTQSTSNLVPLRLAPANKLIAVALRSIVAGPSNRKQDLQGIQTGKSTLLTSLSVFVPSIFCPGFKELMAHNSKFLPTISHAICSSWFRNVQGVVLRQRLGSLSSAKVSEYYDGNGEEGSAERRLSVVQGRLWKMMQRTLYDEIAVKRLWTKDESLSAENTDLNEEICEDEDLFCENGTAGRLKEYVEEDFMDDPEELLFEDVLNRQDDPESDGGILDYLDEKERLATEAETEEMLFGSGRDWGAWRETNGEDELLLFGMEVT